MVKGESEIVLADFMKAVVLTGHGALDKLVTRDDLPQNVSFIKWRDICKKISLNI